MQRISKKGEALNAVEQCLQWKLHPLKKRCKTIFMNRGYSSKLLVTKKKGHKHELYSFGLCHSKSSPTNSNKEQHKI